MVPFDAQDEDSDSVYARANNDIVTAIDQLTLSGQTTTVWIQGGSDYQQVTRGKVVELDLADNLLTYQSQVTSVSLVSMNLSSRIYDILTMAPSSIVALSLSNTLITDFPAHLESLGNMGVLHLADNYITAVNASITWEKLTLLDLCQNNVTTFEGNFPSLTDLFLNGNNLTEIPSVIFTFQYLTKLMIQGNSLSSRTFTESQITFLQRLTSLDLVDSDFLSAVNCSSAEQRVVGDNKVVVCASIVEPDPSSSASSASSSDFPVSRISGSTSMGSDRSSVSSDKSKALIVVTSVAGFVVLGALSATIIYYWRQHDSKRSKGLYNNWQRKSSNHRSSTIGKDRELVALQVSCDDIQDLRLIGSGAFSVVWLVSYRDAVLLASKRIHEDVAMMEDTHTFVEEIYPNIVAFIGEAWSSGFDLQALFEFVENGDLRSYLSATSLSRYWTRTKLQLAVDVIEAIVYVHTFTSPVALRNLKSHNVLISAEMQAKLTDVGATRFLRDSGSEVGTSRWLAPEVISGRSDYNPAADIFAFGALLSEFDTHALPYHDATDNGGNKLDGGVILQMVASGNLRPTFSDTCPPIILELAKQCMTQEPRDRPPALKVAYTLRTLQREAFNL
ncbi:hypothetical protein PR001_g25198 [Phytophthora rubi]|uniref:Protein kinase domain-containing protein n=1 Tax=Phytophthora rubi TaxID=129364 RepID=A0A6A3I6J8_9STRA|nr:hypothetical protein PR002_g25487 [Phytophthora rubi]KAE8977191.1 hypothetical protein PR001_g25198 [Phytophthora rubi]